MKIIRTCKLGSQARASAAVWSVYFMTQFLLSPRSIPETWVTVYSGDIGNTFILSLRALSLFLQAWQELRRACRRLLGRAYRPLGYYPR